MSATWERTIPVSGPTAASELGLGVQTHGMPTDGFFAFAVPGYDAESSVVFPAPPNDRSPIYKPDVAVLVMVSWRGGFETSMTIRWWQGATEPPPGASIVPVLAYPAPEGVLFDTFPNSTFDDPWQPRTMLPEPLATQTF